MDQTGHRSVGRIRDAPDSSFRGLREVAIASAAYALGLLGQYDASVDERFEQLNS